VSCDPRRPCHGTTLVDILDRILDKGLVVAGDGRISLANRRAADNPIRLLVCSIDKAEQIGLNWWHYDRSLIAQEEATIRMASRIAELERLLATTAAREPETESIQPTTTARAAQPRKR